VGATGTTLPAVGGKRYAAVGALVAVLVVVLVVLGVTHVGLTSFPRWLRLVGAWRWTTTSALGAARWQWLQWASYWWWWCCC